jgi:hypothetical protein
MPTLYSYVYASEGEGPWWGIRVDRNAYANMVRDLQDATRCFVHLVNEQGDSIVVAVEGPHREDNRDAIFAPEWVLQRLNIESVGEVMMEPIPEAFPKGTRVRLRPLTGRTVEGPMFVEGLTEALNQLGVVQEGLLTAQVDPSLPDELHHFMVELLEPASVCLADGELTVELERAADRPPTPPPAPRPETPPSAQDTEDGGFDTVFGPGGSRLSGTSVAPAVSAYSNMSLAFSGPGHILGADASGHGANGWTPPPRPRLGGGDHPLLRKIRAEAEQSKTNT